MTDKTKKTAEELKKEEVARETWDSWLDALEGQDQPKACSIDDEDCEACGS